MATGVPLTKSSIVPVKVMVGTEPATVELGVEDVELDVIEGAELVGGGVVETTVVEVVGVAEAVVVVLVVVLVVGWLEDDVVDD